MRTKEQVSCLQLLQPDACWHTANQDVHDLTQGSSSILPITHFKLKIQTDA